MNRTTFFKPHLILSILYLVLSFFLRITLWVVFGRAGYVHESGLISALLIGVLNDLVAISILLLPLTLVMLFLPYLKALKVTLFLLIFGALYLLPAEFFFFDEFDSRFNLVAVDYFAYPTEVLGNLWESYPIVWFLIGTLVIAALISKYLWPFLAQNSFTFLRRLKLTTLHLAVAVCAFFFFPVEFFLNSQNRVQNQIAANGVLTFFEAARTNEIEFDHFYRTLEPNEAFRLVREELIKNSNGKFISENPSNLMRSFAANPDGLGKLNVVILAEESLGAQFIGVVGEKKGLSPNFDRLSNEGILFTNAFATGTRTVRGLEGITMSLPPIPSESTVKRPNNENMANLGEVLKLHGYHTSFLYGGFGMFDNMNYFFGHNGFNLSDRTDIKSPRFANIWGVSDEDLLSHAVNYFDNISSAGKPFFSLIMTTSNHKPFTFREGIPGVPASGGGREAGVKYADFAIGEFFKEAPKHDWYKNTIFLIIGDHDSRVYGRAYIPVERYRIAMLLLAPGKIAPQRFTKITSQIDVAPTILGLLGLSYQAPFYGVNVLDSAAADSRAVLLNHNHNVGLFKDGNLAVSGLNRSIETFLYKDGKTEKTASNKELESLLTAYLQTAYQLYKEKKYKL